MNLCFLSLLLSLAAPPECARDDLACTARMAAREAKDATDPAERAEARLTAARAHLALYQRTGLKDHLCRARRFAAALRPTPELGDLLPATREQIERELTGRGITCPKGQRPPRPPEGATTASEPSTPPAMPLEHPVGAPPTSEPERADPPAPPPRDELLPVEASTHGPIVQVPPREPTSTHGPVVLPTRGADGPDAGPPAGRRLLIAGGVLAGGAAIAGGLAAVAAARADGLAGEQNAVAATTHDQGFTDPTSRTESDRLSAEIAHWERVLLGASLTCAVVGSTAVALLTTGAVKRRRAARVVITPGFAGLLWAARF